MLLPVSAVFIFFTKFWSVCSFVIPAWAQFSTCLSQILLDDKKYWFVVTSELLFHMTFGYFGHVIWCSCNGEIWAAGLSPGSGVVGMLLVWAVD